MLLNILRSLAPALVLLAAGAVFGYHACYTSLSDAFARNCTANGSIHIGGVSYTCSAATRQGTAKLAERGA